MQTYSEVYKYNYLEPVECSIQNNFIKLSNSYEKEIYLSGTLCPNYTDNDIQLLGDIAGYSYDYFKITVRECN